MSLFSILNTAVWCFALFTVSKAFKYQEPELIWVQQTSDDAGLVGGGVGEGNGLFMSPDGNLLVSTSVDATVRAFDPVTGDIKWTYVPNHLGLPVRCFGGVTFANYRSGANIASDGVPYLVYAIADGANDPVNNPTATTRVIALYLESGKEMFQSTALQGIAAGAPVTDFEGTHILLTHNEDRLKGYISIFFLSGILGIQNQTTITDAIPPVLTKTYTDDNSMERPFSPIGYFHNPAEGFYEGGQFNTNDFFLFAWDTPRTAVGVNPGDGQKFAVQFPITYLGDGQGLSFFPLGGPVDYHASTPPILNNAGRSYYWSISKSGQDCCLVGTEPLPRYRFDRDRRTSHVAMQRGNPRYRSSRAPPTLGRAMNPEQPKVCGVGAGMQVWCMDHQYSANNRTIISTSDIVSTKILFTPREDFILYGTQSTVTAGGLHIHSTQNLQKIWEIPIPGGVDGDIAMDKAGTIVYVANPTGQLRAYQFAQE